MGSLAGRLAAAALVAMLLAGCGRSAPPQPAALSAQDLQALKTKAEGGNAQAQRDLGAAYAKGNGVKQDYDEAAKWYEKAAGQGNASAQAALGELYKRRVRA